MRKLTVAHFTIDFYLRGGVQCWIDMVARHTVDRLTHYVLTPNTLSPAVDTPCIVPEFGHAPANSPSLRRHLAPGELPRVGDRSNYITDEILSYVVDEVKPDIVIIYGNDAEELHIPARLLCANALIVLRLQFHNDLPVDFARRYADAVIMFHDNRQIIELGKPTLELHRTYDDTVFRNLTPFGDRRSDAVAYFGRFNDLKGVGEFDAIVSILAAHGKSLHLYTVPTPAANEAKIQALKDRFPDNLVCFPWITDRHDLAAANNAYRVVISPGASNNLADTFGQSNLEAVACGANLVVLLEPGTAARYPHAGDKYLKYRDRLYLSAANAQELAHMALCALEEDMAPGAAVDDDLEDFKISRQQDQIVSFLEEHHAAKFG